MMQLLNDANQPELLAKNASAQDAFDVATQVANMNNWLKEAGHEHYFVTHFIDGCISIRQLS